MQKYNLTCDILGNRLSESKTKMSSDDGQVSCKVSNNTDILDNDDMSKLKSNTDMSCNNAEMSSRMSNTDMSGNNVDMSSRMSNNTDSGSNRTETLSTSSNDSDHRYVNSYEASRIHDKFDRN